VFNLSSADDGYFPTGETFAQFKHRTGTWTVDSTHERNGWNFAFVRHVIGSDTRETNFFEWIVDDDATATTFASRVLDTLSMTGSSFLSGVEYHTGGTALFDVQISNLHRNTYSNSNSAISYITANCIIPSSPLSTIAAESDNENITNAVVTIVPATNNRILNGSITVQTSVDRTIQSDLTDGTSTSLTGILIDSNGETSTATNENLNGEDFRVPSNRTLTDITGFTIGGAGFWDSTLDIVAGVPSNAGYDGFDGYDAGLLVHDGQVFYPNDASVANTGYFSTITNGSAGNPDYSGATGQRVYWRYFFFSSSTSNFVLNLNATGTVVDAGTVSSSTDEISVEFLLPNTTQDGVGTIEFKDANIAFTDIDSIGCFASTFGTNVGDVAGLDWGISFGSRNTSTSGNAVIIRIVAGDGWTGDISNIQFDAA
jgi:hypothetical protein